MHKRQNYSNCETVSKTTQRNSHLFKVKSTNKCYYFKTTSRLQSHGPNKNIPPDKNDFGDFPSKDASCFWSSHNLFCHASDTICSKDKNHYAFGQVILCLAMLLLTQYAPKTRMKSLTTYFPRFRAKNEIYYSLLLFICHYSLLLFTVTIHSEFLPI